MADNKINKANFQYGNDTNSINNNNITDSKKEYADFEDFLRQNNLDKPKKNEAVTEKKRDDGFVAAGKNDDFDIVDFVIKHSDGSSVRKKSIVPKVILVVMTVILLVGICVTLAFISKSRNDKTHPLFGTWKSQQGNFLKVTDEYVEVDGKQTEYIFEEDNVISIKMQNEYIKMIYLLDGDDMTLIIPLESNVSRIEYTRL